jgi:hypothetical protein
MFEFKVGDIVRHRTIPSRKNGSVCAVNSGGDSVSVNWTERGFIDEHSHRFLELVRRPLDESEIKSLREDV